MGEGVQCEIGSEEERDTAGKGLGGGGGIQPLPSKETYYTVKRDLLQCQKRPIHTWDTAGKGLGVVGGIQPLPSNVALPLSGPARVGFRV